MYKPEGRPNRRILLIDDNEAIHADFRAILEQRNEDGIDLDLEKAALFGEEQSVIQPAMTYDIDSAFQGEEGLEKIRQSVREGRPYALAFVDIRMPPGMDGIQTIKQIWHDHSDIEIVICSAYSDYSWHDMIRELGQTDKLLILKKPFDNIEVQQLASSLTLKWQLMNRLDQMVKQRTREIYNWVRELDCLHNVSCLIETLEVSLEEILQSIVDFIPAAFQNPDITCARITLLDQPYQTENFSSTAWNYCVDISAQGVCVGALEVCYLQERQPMNSGPFLKEERELIDHISQQLAYVVERDQAESVLMKENQRLKRIVEELNADTLEMSKENLL
jgi:CheY-like chemotaxis protein